MSELQEMVVSAFKEAEDSHFVEKCIKENVEKMIKSVVEDTLRSYSPVSKTLKEKLEEALQIDLDRISFAQYSASMVQMIESAANKEMTNISAEFVKKRMESLFEAPPPLITLSDVIADFIQDNDDVDMCDPDREDKCGLVIEKSEHGYIYVGLNKSEFNGRYGVNKEKVSKVAECDIQLHFRAEDDDPSNLKIVWISFGGFRTITTSSFLPSIYYGFSRRLFQMYVGGTSVILDNGMEEDEYETYYPEAYR